MYLQQPATQLVPPNRSSSVRKRRRWGLAGFLGLALTAIVAVGHAPFARAGSGGGTGSPCSLANVNVSVNPAGITETLYVYEVDCPGQPLGWFGGAVTAKYQVIGNWDPQTNTAHDNVFSFDRNEGVFDTWTCSADPWITSAQDANNSIAGGHTCQLQSQQGGDDWTTDSNPSVSFGSVLCFNDPWGVSLAGCWSNDDIAVTGPSAALQRAWETAEQQAGAPANLLPIPLQGGILGSLLNPFAIPQPLHGPISLPETSGRAPTPTPTPLPVHPQRHGG
jgi:hypothetical protein